MALKVPWEALRPGPVGEHVEVMDVDPASECFYLPVDLDAPPVLVQSGLSPAEGDPQFHQQMVYAVVMSTVRQFERGLGRSVLWSPNILAETGGAAFVRRLRVYPHALRGPQAYYSPGRKALLFGYFPLATESAAGEPAPTTFFTCLSHGIAAHETAHAILDGLRRTVDLEDSGPDELAVQEALADLAALLQHIAVPGFLRDRLRVTSDLDENRRQLEAMAHRLAQPLGRPAELRKQIGAAQADTQPAPQAAQSQEQAALMVAAVFDALAAAWRQRCAQLLALRGAAPAGEPLARGLHDACCAEAAKIATHLLQMCIRAIDYCPPVDVSFEDFLRAVVTADADLFPDDARRYRVALVEAFRRRGLVGPMPLQLAAAPPQGIALPARMFERDTEPAADRMGEFAREMRMRARLFERWLGGGKDALKGDAARALGLALDASAPRTIARTKNELPMVIVDNCRLARRTGADGRLVSDWVITITQLRNGYFDPDEQDAQDSGARQKAAEFVFRGGCTLLVDAASGAARLCMVKDILSGDRLARNRESVLRRRLALAALGGATREESAEPFLALRGQSVVRHRNGG